jgi:hypothetical protein
VFVMKDGLTGPAREPEHFDPVGSQAAALVGIGERLPFERGGMYDQPRPTALPSTSRNSRAWSMWPWFGLSTFTPEVAEDDVRGGCAAVEVVIAGLRAPAVLCTATATVTAEAGAVEAAYHSSEPDGAEER